MPNICPSYWLSHNHTTWGNCLCLCPRRKITPMSLIRSQPLRRHELSNVVYSIDWVWLWLGAALFPQGREVFLLSRLFGCLPDGWSFFSLALSSRQADRGLEPHVVHINGTRCRAENNSLWARLMLLFTVISHIGGDMRLQWNRYTITICKRAVWENYCNICDLTWIFF